jgi:hypothetical protein
MTGWTLPRLFCAAQGGQFDVGPDGRFLINTVLNDDGVIPITIIQNWRGK